MASSKGGRRDNPLDRLRHLHPDEIGQDALGELLHDLQVSQEELTAQNAQLIETQHALEASRDRYVDLYDFAPIGFMTINVSGMKLPTIGGHPITYMNYRVSNGLCHAIDGVLAL